MHDNKDRPLGLRAAVSDLHKSADYFRDVPGFRVLWQEATDWRLVERDGVRVMLGHCPHDLRPADLGSHNWFGCLNADDVKALYDELMARGAACTPQADQPYGMREIVVTTLDGQRIVFGQERRQPR